MDFDFEEYHHHAPEPDPASSQSETEDEEEDDEHYAFHQGDEDPLSPSPNLYRTNIMKLINSKAEFKFSINYQLHTDLLPYFWASIHEYFQDMLEQFIISDGGRLTDFRKIANNFNLESIYKCAYTIRGSVEQKKKHFLLVFQIILDAAKFQWLAPWKTRNSYGLSTCIQRQIGGMFLSYYLLVMQPEPPPGILATVKQRMRVDPDDSRAVRFFLNDLNKLDDDECADLKKEVRAMFLKLHEQDLFQKTVEEYSLEAPHLILNSIKSDPRLSYFSTLKDIRDKLLHMTYQGIGNTTFRELLKLAQEIYGMDSDTNKKSCDTDVKTGSSNLSSNSSSTRQEPKSKATVTFQTRLRQTLNRQFQLFQDKLSTQNQDENPNPNLELPQVEKTNPLYEPSSNCPPKPPTELKNEQKTFHTKEAKTFPPETKTQWTVEDVNALRSERDLSVIAFRVIEILRFITPENPLTTSRLINGMRVDQNAKDLMDSIARRENLQHNQRLEAPSRLAKLSKEGKHRFIETAQTQGWMEYLTSNSKSKAKPRSKKDIPAAQMLKMLKTHDVVATEPRLVFKRYTQIEMPDISGDISEEEETFEFADEERAVDDWEQEADENFGWAKSMFLNRNSHPPAAPSAHIPHKPESNKCGTNTQEFVNMPDLNRFWEEEEEVEASSPFQLGPPDEPPNLSMNATGQCPSSSISIIQLPPSDPVQLVKPSNKLPRRQKLLSPSKSLSAPTTVPPDSVPPKQNNSQKRKKTTSTISNSSPKVKRKRPKTVKPKTQNPKSIQRQRKKKADVLKKVTTESEDLPTVQVQCNSSPNVEKKGLKTVKTKTQNAKSVAPQRKKRSDVLKKNTTDCTNTESLPTALSPKIGKKGPKAAESKTHQTLPRRKKKPDVTKKGTLDSLEILPPTQCPSSPKVRTRRLKAAETESEISNSTVSTPPRRRNKRTTLKKTELFDVSKKDSAKTRGLTVASSSSSKEVSKPPSSPKTKRKRTISKSGSKPI